MKLARLYTEKSGFISTLRGFHGKSYGSLSLMGKAEYRIAFEPLLQDVYFVEFGDADEVEWQLKKARDVGLLFQGSHEIHRDLVADEAAGVGLRQAPNGVAFGHGALRTGEWHDPASGAVSLTAALGENVIVAPEMAPGKHPSANVGALSSWCRMVHRVHITSVLFPSFGAKHGN